MQLDVQPLSKEAFAPYGDVIGTAESDFFLINNGSTRRYHDLAKVELLEGGRTLINIFQATPLSYPLRVEMVERHPLGSQAFIPLSNRPYLVVVAKAGEVVTPSDLKAFIAAPGLGVNYHAGTWHHPVLALDDISNFLVVDRGGDGHNCDEIFFENSETFLNRP
ncbi:ureidoglycolate hydrolase [Alphaproteobacteria bacterium 46_93_T64]|nr:ureidoglycolate hydrolase [Alphaproteobacteria bacterium 46_93_T64]